MSDGMDPKQWERAFSGLPDEQLMAIERVEEIRNGETPSRLELDWLCDSYATAVLIKLAAEREKISLLKQRLVWARDAIDAYVAAAGTDDEDAISDCFGGLKEASHDAKKVLAKLDLG
jgi:hypothetical protein